MSIHEEWFPVYQVNRGTAEAYQKGIEDVQLIQHLDKTHLDALEYRIADAFAAPIPPGKVILINIRDQENFIYRKPDSSLAKCPLMEKPADIDLVENHRLEVLVEPIFDFLKDYLQSIGEYELVKARLRGVDVRVIIPMEGNHGIMNASNVTAANTLLKYGVRVFTYPGMSQVKAAIYDGWACLGSVNFDKLSFLVNKGMNLAARKRRLWMMSWIRSSPPISSLPWNCINHCQPGGTIRLPRSSPASCKQHS